MKYLKKFENHAAYEAAESGLILPNVSLCAQENEVHYKPYVPPIIDGHEYVDLGLPSSTKWATMNVGASTVTDYGNYYMYGKGSRPYNSSDPMYEGTENPLSMTYDTARQAWGGQWHMPTLAQFRELTANTTYTWETNFNGSGINGGKFTTSNGKYVFFPAAGMWYNGSQSDVGSNGYYWSSTPNDSYYAYRLFFYSSSKDVGSSHRNLGFSVRPVVG